MPTVDSFEVLWGYSACQIWLKEVCKASDSHRHELGFLPWSVFEQFARRDELYVLVAHSPDGQKYAGHLLFDRRFPRAHVRQMFTSAEYRRRGAASQLLEHLRRSLTDSGFISLYARVAEDLGPANAFWQAQGFYVQRSEKGGVSKSRQILVRCLELDSPQLFPRSGINEHNPLGLLEIASNDLPMYLLDMNVLFDVQPRRLRRSEVVSLFQAERMNFCRLAISNEIRDELQRNLQGKQTDPMGAYIDTFPCLPVYHGRDADVTFSELAKLVFPSTTDQPRLTVNERSDLRHVMTAIQHDLAGLITNDGALLAAARAIKEAYGIQVLSSSAFEIEESAARSEAAFETVEKNTLRLLSVAAEQEPAIREFLSKKAHLSGSAIASSWLPIETSGRIALRCAVWSSGLCIGYATWPAPVPFEGMLVARAAVDETHPQAVEAARVLLLHLVEC